MQNPGLILEILPLVAKEFDGNITGRVISITNLYTDIRARIVSYTRYPHIENIGKKGNNLQGID